jgi:hypothetical protein
MAWDGEHFFMYLLAIWTSSLETFLFICPFEDRILKPVEIILCGGRDERE